MLSDAALFLLAIVAVALLLFVTVYVIILLSDYESDHLNSSDLCARLNYFLLPEFIGQWALTAIFLVHGSWIALIVNLPLAIHRAKLVTQDKHMYDETVLHRLFDDHKRHSMIRLSFYLICFFLYLYRMIVGLLEGSL